MSLVAEDSSRLEKRGGGEGERGEMTYTHIDDNSQLS